MERFFIYTKGRTGSTAIVDELSNHSKLFMSMEPFLNYKLMKNVTIEQIKEIYPSVMPYYIWKDDRINQNLIYRKKLTHLLKFQLPKTDQIATSLYLDALQKAATHKKAFGFGFKILPHHFTDLPYLNNLIKSYSFKSIYLRRENVVKQIISGQIARKSKVWNTKKNNIHNDAYEINLNEFEQSVNAEINFIDQGREYLRGIGSDMLEVTYEDFCKDRHGFYAKIFNFLNLPYESLKQTEYSIMVPDVAKLVSNYDELKQKVCAMGMGKWLE